MELGPLVVVSFVVLVGERLVQAFEPVVKPLMDWLDEKMPKYKGWGMMVFSWLGIGGLVTLTGANLFDSYIQSAVAGRVLTALVAGGGANLLHDLWPNKSAGRVWAGG